MLENTHPRVRALVERLQKTDPRLYQEIRDKAESAGARTMAAESMDFAAAGGVATLPAAAMALETIVLETGRPVLQILRDEVQLEFRNGNGEEWRDRLKAARRHLLPAIRAVGRIEITNHPNGIDWVGTGWLVADDVLVTNRHVAELFSSKRRGRFVFKTSYLGAMTSSIDYLEELDNHDTREMSVTGILHIEPEPGPDLAFLQVDRAGDTDTEPIGLSTKAAIEDFVAVIGYPARDSRIPDQKLMTDIFGEVYEKKRLAPGQLMKVGERLMEHDCSTLGGNSGSVVLDLATGEAVGLHHAGTFKTANYAVPAAVVRAKLDEVAKAEARSRSMPTDGPKPAAPTPAAVAPTPSSAPIPAPAPAPASHSLSFVIPIRVSVDVGVPDFGSVSVTASVASLASGLTSTLAPSAPTLADAEELAIETEAPVSAYANRKGYQPDFLGETVPLPEVRKNAADVLTFGDGESELKYEHFSVVMNRPRRMCVFSAVNIDGKTSRRTVRSGWKLDPRIPKQQQIKGECYGAPPKYSRGHMTRREDPAWGTQQQADRGSDDSMHVTNSVPQMQSFNGGIWLSLEDYALRHARKDDQRITVFTGPFFTRSDPEQYGVRIPKAFWKVIAFIHDQTGELTATGYSISQEEHIPNVEYVFGEFGTHQRSLAWIEQRSGVSFGELTSRDPLNTQDEARESASAPLAKLSQIRLRR